MTAAEPTVAVDLTKPASPQRRRKTEWTTLRQRIGQWRPDPRWAHPAETALWLYVVAVATTRPGYALPPLVFTVVAPVGIGLSVWWTRRTWPDTTYGDQFARDMAWVCGIASVAAAAWLLWAALTSPWRALPALLLATVFFGAWYWVLRSTAPKVAQAVADEREAALLERTHRTWQELLDVVEPRLRVADVRSTRGGHVIGVEPKDPTKPVSFADLNAKMPTLTTMAAAKLAAQGITVSAGTIRAEETEAAHVHLIHVNTRQILRESIPYEPFDGPGTGTDPLDFGLFEDGQPVTFTPASPIGGVSGQIIGGSGSGKSRVLNSMIGRAGECGDVLIGVVATSKLVPAVYPWIKPWLEGKADRPAIDFVAGQDPEQVMLMLAAIYQIVSAYNDGLSNESTTSVSPERPAIVLFIEEAGQIPRHGVTVTTHDGQKADFSALIDMITAVCRSANVGVWLVNQNALFDAYGARGPQIQRNTPYRICLKTMAPSDGANTLPGLGGAWGDTSKLRHNTMLVQPSIEEPRIMPAKAYNLGQPHGDPIEPIAIRNGAWRPELPEHIAEQLGDIWTGRWDANRLPELAKAAERDGLVWPVGRIEDDVDRALRELIEQETSTTDTTTDTTAITADVPTTTGTPMSLGSLGLPDADADARELSEIAKRPAITLPQPLQAVIELLREPGAPRDFVPSRALVILLGRVDADADEKTLDRAADELARQLRDIDDEIRTIQRRVNGKRSRGYDVPKLHEIAARIAGGMQ